MSFLNETHKIEDSARILTGILGPHLSHRFEIRARITSNNRTTFSLYYLAWGGAICLYLDAPLKVIRKGLARFAAENTLSVFPQVQKAVDDLTTSALFERAQLNGGGCDWCGYCKGLTRGKVIYAPGTATMVQIRMEGMAPYITSICRCEGGQVNVEFVDRQRRSLREG
jgi:hypothetical protein